MSENKNINTFRNLPSMDMTNQDNIKSAVQADVTGTGVSGFQSLI